jgi:hypothetical protein
MTLTRLERGVLSDIRSGIDPWHGKRNANGSRLVSQTIQRLIRKGAMVESDAGGKPWPRPELVTEEGRAVLDEPLPSGRPKRGTRLPRGPRR